MGGLEVQVFSFFKGRCPLEAPREESSWQTKPRRCTTALPKLDQSLTRRAHYYNYRNTPLETRAKEHIRGIRKQLKYLDKLFIE